MSILDETRFLERLQFFDGQRLFAADLQGPDEFNREMRWLHNRSLHQVGIGSGYAVYGKKGDREVKIGAGYAIDAKGREIVLIETRIEPIPPVASDGAGAPMLYDLTVSYPDDSDLEVTETREGVCLPRGVVRRREVPVFCWIRLNKNGQPIDEKLKQDVLTGMKLVLARAEILNCQLDKDLSIAQRRNARPPRQPYIVCGEAAPTDWQLFTLQEEGVGTLNNAATVSFREPFMAPFGLSAEINTSAAQFQTTPCYSARIDGPRLNFVLGSDSDRTDFVIDGLISVRDSLPKSFKVNVLLCVQSLTRGRTSISLFGNTTKDDDTKRLELFSDWKVVWMGVEG
ncbi:MAG: hypothetical protein WCB68_17035 [Pyrinomonadaceae bacterium]